MSNGPGSPKKTSMFFVFYFRNKLLFLCLPLEKNLQRFFFVALLRNTKWFSSFIRIRIRIKAIDDIEWIIPFVEKTSVTLICKSSATLHIFIILKIFIIMRKGIETITRIYLITEACPVKIKLRILKINKKIEASV